MNSTLPINEPRRDWMIGGGLIMLTLLVFVRVGTFEFINYDDPDYVRGNAIVQSGLTWGGIRWAFTELHGEHTYWHPITWLSHMLDCQLFGLKPGPPHLVNLLFHTINVGLLFLVLKRMTGAVWRSAIVAALFAIHPLQVDTVAWVTERKNVLSGMFWMLTMLAYVRYARQPSVARYVPVFVLFALGLMCKPSLVVLPAVLLLLDYWPLNRLVADRQTLVKLALEKVPLFMLSLLSGLITIAAHRGIGMIQTGLSLPDRLANAIVSYGRYAGKALWPTDLTVLYMHPGSWPIPTVVIYGILVLLVTVAAIRLAKPQPSLIVGWLWFLIALVPTIGIIQAGFQAIADRFTYLPMIGFWIMLIWGFGDSLQSRRVSQVITAAIPTAALAACVVLTSLQLGHWKNSVTLFEHAVKVTPNNFLAHNNLGAAYLEILRIDDATRSAHEALRLYPECPLSHFLLGLIHDRQGSLEAAVREYDLAIKFAPSLIEPPRHRANALMRLGRTNEAIAGFEAILQRDPEDIEVRHALGLMLSSQKRTRDAIVQFKHVLRSAPNFPDALNQLAWLLATAPEPELRNGREAVQYAERAAELTGRKQPMVLASLAAAYAEAGRFSEAVTTAENGMRLAISAGDKAAAETNKTMIELFSSGKPLLKDY